MQNCLPTVLGKRKQIHYLSIS